MKIFNKFFLVLFAFTGVLISGTVFAQQLVPKFGFAVYNNSSFIVIHQPPGSPADTFTNANWCDSNSLPSSKIFPGEETPIIETCGNSSTAPTFSSSLFYGYDSNNGCTITLSCTNVQGIGQRFCASIQPQSTAIQCIGTAQASITNEIAPNITNYYIGFTTVTISFPGQGEKK